MLNQKPRPADFVLGTCPSCHKVVRIPVTAVTSQSTSQVKCPICRSAFEIADILDEVIPSVEIVDEPSPENPTEPKIDQRSVSERVNAIDTPELFHGTKENYTPTTEKKNGRFVVPELLSKGIKKKRKRSRRRSSKSPEEKRLVEEGLAKLRQTSAMASGQTLSEPESTPGSDGKQRRGERKQSRSRSSRRSSRRSSSGSGSGSKKDNVINAQELIEWLTVRLSRLSLKFQQPNSKLELAMMIAGGVLAIPILHLMLWWLIGVDPIGLAKPVNSIAPFVVPESLKPESDTQPPLLIPQPEPETTEDESRGLSDGKLPRPLLDF